MSLPAIFVYVINLLICICCYILGILFTHSRGIIYVLRYIYYYVCINGVTYKTTVTSQPRVKHTRIKYQYIRTSYVNGYIP